MERRLTPEDNPLITLYTRQFKYPDGREGIADETLARLLNVREWDIRDDNPVPYQWPTRLRRTLWSPLKQIDTGVALVPKQYQLQMAHHLSRMPRFINGDSVGLGKTLESILAATWLHDRLPTQKIIVFSTKSTTGQWAEEFERFSTLRAKVVSDKYDGDKGFEARIKQFEDFLANDDHDVLVCKYSSIQGKRKKYPEGTRFDDDGYPLDRDRREKVSSEIKRLIKAFKPHGQKITLILDECQKFKTMGSNVRSLVEIISRPCARVWAMTATVIKNGLEEFYSIAAAIGIKPFGSVAEFEEDFCIYRDAFIGNGKTERRLQGYKNVPRFKAGMRPFFFGRSQRQVKEKLPRLSTVIHPIDLSEEQSRLLLKDIPSGKYPLPPRVLKVAGQTILKDRDPDNEMCMLSVYQLVANHPCLLDPTDKKKFHAPGLSPKEEKLLDMLDGDFRGEKVIVFTKSKQWIDRLEHLTTTGKFTERKFLRITGAENETQRNINKQLFQDPDGEHDLIVINSAATEGVNLQQAAHLICLDIPWSYGDLLQLVGRMLRLASPHSACTLHILSARGTIDEYAIETQQGKKGIFEAILGESHSAGLLDERQIFDMGSGMEQSGSDWEFQRLLKAHQKSTSMYKFISGEKLEEAISVASDKPVRIKKIKPKAPKEDKFTEYFDEHKSVWGI